MILDVREARYLRDYVLWLKFNDGAEGEINLESELKGEVFGPLKDIAQFRRFRVDPELKPWSGRTAPTLRRSFSTTTCESWRNHWMDHAADTVRRDGRVIGRRLVIRIVGDRNEGTLSGMKAHFLRLVAVIGVVSCRWFGRGG